MKDKNKDELSIPIRVLFAFELFSKLHKEEQNEIINRIIALLSHEE